MEILLALYVLIILHTIFFAAKKKTRWFAIIGVIIFPIYFFFVLWDLFKAEEALRKIDDSIAKKATKMKSCQACYKNFPQGVEEKELCPSCLRLNKIGGWLPLFILGVLGSSVGSFYDGYIISQQSSHDSTLIGTAFIVFGISFLIGFVVLITKVRGTRVYLLSIIVIYLIVLISIFSDVIEDRAVILSLFRYLILLHYFWLSRRVKVIYRMD